MSCECAAQDGGRHSLAGFILLALPDEDDNEVIGESILRRFPDSGIPLLERRLEANDAIYDLLDAAEAARGEVPNATHPYEWGFSRLVLDGISGKLLNRIRRGLPWGKVRAQIAEELPEAPAVAPASGAAAPGTEAPDAASSAPQAAAPGE